MRIRITPDAYEVHDDIKTLTIIEVVETHPIRLSKAGQIYRIGAALERVGWGCTVAVFDYCGGLLAELPFTAFYPPFLRRFVTREHVDVLPAALRACRDAGFDYVRPDPMAPSGHPHSYAVFVDSEGTRRPKDCTKATPINPHPQAAVLQPDSGGRST